MQSKQHDVLTKQDLVLVSITYMSSPSPCFNPPGCRPRFYHLIFTTLFLPPSFHHPLFSPYFTSSFYLFFLSPLFTSYFYLLFLLPIFTYTFLPPTRISPTYPAGFHLADHPFLMIDHPFFRCPSLYTGSPFSSSKTLTHGRLTTYYPTSPLHWTLSVVCCKRKQQHKNPPPFFHFKLVSVWSKVCSFNLIYPEIKIPHTFTFYLINT